MSAASNGDLASHTRELEHAVPSADGRASTPCPVGKRRWPPWSASRYSQRRPIHSRRRLRHERKVVPAVVLSISSFTRLRNERVDLFVLGGRRLHGTHPHVANERGSGHSRASCCLNIWRRIAKGLAYPLGFSGKSMTRFRYSYDRTRSPTRRGKASGSPAGSLRRFQAALR